VRDNPLVALFLVFAPLSLLSVGGGQSVVAEAHRQVVQEHHWLTDAQFLTDYLLSRMSPGPSSLIVMLIGHQVAGPAGAVVAIVAMFLPSSLLVYVVAHVWARHKDAPWRASVQRGLAPIAAGLILATGWTLLQSTEGGWAAWALASVAAAMMLVFRWHPLVAIGAGAGAFLALGAVPGLLS
jgi:chromate transporter